MPVKRWNFRKAKWSHYIALTNKFAKTLLPLIHLMWTRLTRTSVTSSRKQPKRLFHAGIKTTIFRVGMRSVNPSIELFCNLLRETTRVLLLHLCVPSLTGSGKINGPRQFRASTFHTLIEKHRAVDLNRGGILCLRGGNFLKCN